VSPVVRRYAEKLGVELTAVHGTGPSGRVTHADVDAAVRPPVPAPTRPRITPYARRRARELGVDLDQLQVPDGRPVRALDVEAAAVAAPAVPYPKKVAARPGTTGPAPTAAGPAPTTTAAAPTAQERTAAMRKAIGALMSRSKREVPHYYLTDTVDLSSVVEWLRAHNQDLPVAERMVVAALFCKATALAARRVPQVNGFWVDDAFQPADAVHLGVAVSLRGGGLVTPAIHDAASLTLDETMSALRDLVERSRRGVLHRRELTEGTLTVTNLGERGAESVLGVIFPPQVGLVGFGRVADSVRAVDGLVGVRPTTTVTFSGDHRAGDGHTGGVFLDAVRTLLEHPEEL
jgi:pyruvate dehydrogenase E2 component (dihydrolipoamide acetyltransferase)